MKKFSRQCFVNLDGKPFLNNQFVAINYDEFKKMFSIFMNNEDEN